MEVAGLKNQIKTRNLQPFYILTGTEWQVQKIYIDQIVKVSGKQKKYIDNVTDIYGKLKNRSFINTSCVYIVRDDKELINNEKLQSRIEGVLGDNILILLLTSIDKRTKFYKQYKDKICEFEPLSPALLKKYVQKEIRFSDKVCDRFMEVCEYDYGRCLLEIDKIKRYTTAYNDGNSNEIDPSQVFEWLLKDGTIYQPPKDALFDFVGCVLKRQVRKAYSLLEQCYAVGEATLVLLSVLYTNARQVLQVQGFNGGDITKSTGLTGWQVKCAKENSGYYTTQELENMLKLIQKCESGIKSGRIDESVVMDYLLIHIFSEETRYE